MSLSVNAIAIRALPGRNPIPGSQMPYRPAGPAARPARRRHPTSSLWPGDRAEEPIRFFVRAGREEERVGRAVIRGPVAELQCPQAIDRDRLPVCGTQLAAMLESPVRQLRVGVDLPIAEIAHEEIAAESPEVRRSERESPGGVQLAMLRDAGEQYAGGVVDVDESLSLPVDVIDRARSLLRIRDEDPGTDRLYPERGVSGGQIGIDEGARPTHEVEARVEYVDAPIVEIRRVEPVARDRRREREPLVDRAGPRAVGEDYGLIPIRRKPAAYLAGFGVEDEPGARTRRPEHRAGRFRRHLNDERDDRAVGAIEGRDIRAVVRDPPGRSRSRGETPGVHQVRVGV